jgi:hypothetical protein
MVREATLQGRSTWTTQIHASPYMRREEARRDGDLHDHAPVDKPLAINGMVRPERGAR